MSPLAAPAVGVFGVRGASGSISDVKRKLRILVAKAGLDGHDRGAKVVARALAARGAGDVVLFGGGIVPDEDAVALKAMGVAAIFTPGTSTQAIVDWIEHELRPRVEGAAA